MQSTNQSIVKKKRLNWILKTASMQQEEEKDLLLKFG